MIPPRTAASVSRTMDLESSSAMEMCGKMKASVFMDDRFAIIFDLMPIIGALRDRSKP
jgi:hypothetical protein